MSDKNTDDIVLSVAKKLVYILRKMTSIFPAGLAQKNQHTDIQPSTIIAKFVNQRTQKFTEISPNSRKYDKLKKKSKKVEEYLMFACMLKKM